MEVYNVTHFNKLFPVGTIITVDEFDDWAIDSGLISDPNTDDKSSAEWMLLLKERNNTRAALNKIAVQSDLYQADEKFSVEVHVYGESYFVKSINDHLESKATRMPVKVMQSFQTKAKQIETLMNSTDLENLPPETRIRVNMVGRSTARLTKTMEFTLNQAQEELEDIFNEVREHSRTFEGISNGGFKAIDG